MKSMIRNYKTGEVKAALNMHNRLFPLFRKLFATFGDILLGFKQSKYSICLII